MKNTLFSARKVRAPLMLSMLTGAIFLSACAEDDLILPGKREDIRAVQGDGQLSVVERPENQTRAISLGAVKQNADWQQSMGTPEFRTNHPALGTNLTRVWSAKIGDGDSRKHRITADPVVAGGLIFTLDSESLVTATALNGQRVWSADLRPSRDKQGQATGGGISFSDGKLFVSLGYGTLVALDAASGAEIWRQRLQGTGSGSPTVFDGIVYLTAGDDRGWAISADNGRQLWQLTASPDVNNVLGAPAPAIADGLAIFGFGSGEVQAVFRRGGLRRWDATVRGERVGTALGSVADVTASPVVSGSTVYVGNQSGRLVALDIASGARVWTANDGASGNIVPAGDSVFVLSDLNELLRIDASDGSRVWAARLAKFVDSKPKRRAEIVAHHGPVLAGGRLYVASNDGELRSFDPTDGSMLSSVEIPGGATTKPVVAGGVLYVVSTKGDLHAFR